MSREDDWGLDWEVRITTITEGKYTGLDRRHPKAQKPTKAQMKIVQEVEDNFDGNGSVYYHLEPGWCCLQNECHGVLVDEEDGYNLDVQEVFRSCVVRCECGSCKGTDPMDGNIKPVRD